MAIAGPPWPCPGQAPGAPGANMIGIAPPPGAMATMPGGSPIACIGAGCVGGTVSGDDLASLKVTHADGVGVTRLTSMAAPSKMPASTRAWMLAHGIAADVVAEPLVRYCHEAGCGGIPGGICGGTWWCCGAPCCSGVVGDREDWLVEPSIRVPSARRASAAAPVRHGLSRFASPPRGVFGPEPVPGAAVVLPPNARSRSLRRPFCDCGASRNAAVPGWSPRLRWCGVERTPPPDAASSGVAVARNSAPGSTRSGYLRPNSGPAARSSTSSSRVYCLRGAAIGRAELEPGTAGAVQ
mmetsp:Transcript_17774/g.55145  ORF Transcript_17774/g.55145 Transcript_17774/m.55145 type:complete len:296 (-) Transcript_17774:18-905(-)